MELDKKIWWWVIAAYLIATVPPKEPPDLCSSHNKSITDVVKAPIAKATTKRKGQMDEYHERAKEFIKGKKCAVYPTPKAREVHHMAEDQGNAIGWKILAPVSRKGHVMIEMKPEWAKKMGYSVSRIKQQTVWRSKYSFNRGFGFM